MPWVVRLLMKNYILISLVLILFIGCKSKENTTQLNNTDYEFYSTAIDSIFDSPRTIVLRDSVVIPYQENDKTPPTLTADAKDLEAKYLIERRKLSTKSEITLLSYPELVRIMKRENNYMWDNFYNDFPNSVGWVVLSTISFNEDSTQANFRIQHGCGAYCGGEYEVIFENKSGNWKLAYLMQHGEP